MLRYKDELNQKKKQLKEDLKQIEKDLKACKMFSQKWQELWDKQNLLRIDLATVKSRIENLKNKAYIPNIVINNNNLK